MSILYFLGLLQTAGVVPPVSVIRANQLGYLPDAPKVAVLCALATVNPGAFTLTDVAGHVILRGTPTAAKPFGPCVSIFRLDFTAVRKEGEYRIAVRGLSPVTVRVR